MDWSSMVKQSVVTVALCFSTTVVSDSGIDTRKSRIAFTDKMTSRTLARVDLYGCTYAKTVVMIHSKNRTGC